MYISENHIPKCTILGKFAFKNKSFFEKWHTDAELGQTELKMDGVGGSLSSKMFGGHHVGYPLNKS